MEIVLLIGARPYSLPAHSAAELRDRIRTQAGYDRILGYLADAIAEDLERGDCPEPIDVGARQIELLAEHPLRRKHRRAA